MSNTTTPRTDDSEKRLFCTHDGKFQLLDLSRTLERELNAALAEVLQLKGSLELECLTSQRLTRELAEARRICMDTIQKNIT